MQLGRPTHGSSSGPVPPARHASVPGHQGKACLCFGEYRPWAVSFLTSVCLRGRRRAREFIPQAPGMLFPGGTQETVYAWAIQTSTIQAALGADLFLGGQSLLLPSGNAHVHTLIPGGSPGALSKFQPLSSAGECCERRLAGRWHGPQNKWSVEGELQVPWD